MKLDLERAGGLVESFQLQELFIEELGWDHNRSPQTYLEIDGTVIAAKPIAEKRGVQVFECIAADDVFPAYSVRQKAERLIRKIAHEHLVIFTDSVRTRQTWQWVAREPERPTAYKEYTYHRGQSPQAILERLEPITFWLSDEEGLTISGVTTPLKSAFDKDSVTKKFYERFKEEHTFFLKALEGLAENDDREWYASVMLNRLMFVYFVQKKGFLDNDPDYLRNRLIALRANSTEQTFLSFYRRFLLRLFHEGLGAPERNPELDELIGNVPYLNGGLFEVHTLEEDNPDIDVSDEAFERLFDFFDAYQWHLDERPLSGGNEINPDVLGYIFEKYINQKEMGAYYTKDDVTGFISENAILGWVMERVRTSDEMFGDDGLAWNLLSATPDSYLRGAEASASCALPAWTSTCAPDDCRLDQLATGSGVLPEESWREAQGRVTRYRSARERLERGRPLATSELIALGVDLSQFLVDLVSALESTSLVSDLYEAIGSVSVLDPACGSGAFLLAGLIVLEPIHSACLSRMRAFAHDEHPCNLSDKATLARFDEILAQADRHRSERYYVLKRIIVDNLFGVDLMREACEICKLRLFLKLVAQIDSPEQLEPLPDVDFNIRSGNSLVGFATMGAVEEALSSRLDFDNTPSRIADLAEKTGLAVNEYRTFQSEDSTHDRAGTAKNDAIEALQDLSDELSRYLASEYGVDANNVGAYAAWLESHEPFHWLTEFYEIMSSGGFSAVVGNPPWKEYSKVKKHYTVLGHLTVSCGNLHGLFTERACTLAGSDGHVSFIVQLPMVSSSRMEIVRNALLARDGSLLLATFDDRPGRLFEGLEHCRATIFLSQPGCGVYSSNYKRWPSENRPHLFGDLRFIRTEDPLNSGQFPKIGSIEHAEVLGSLASSAIPLGTVLSPSKTRDFVFYQESAQYWVKAAHGLPYYAKDGKVGAPAHGRYAFVRTEDEAAALFALISSSLFYLYFITYSDCFHVSASLVESFPIPKDALQDARLSELGTALMANLEDNSQHKTISTRGGNSIEYVEYFGAISKPIIDKIDARLLDLFGMDASQLAFVTHYDQGFRVGRAHETQSR